MREDEGKSGMGLGVLGFVFYSCECRVKTVLYSCIWSFPRSVSPNARFNLRQ